MNQLAMKAMILILILYMVDEFQRSKTVMRNNVNFVLIQKSGLDVESEILGFVA